MSAPLLPIALAIRQTLADVVFSNPVPFWKEPLSIDFDRREHIIDERVGALLRGDALTPVFEVDVPKRAGGSARWLVPSINDQIVLQVAVASTAQELEHTLDRSKALSYGINRDPATIAFTHSQIESWQKFQDLTKERAGSAGYVLQLDLLRAYENMAPAKVIQFLESRVKPSRGRELVVRLINLLTSGRQGMPHVNDSIFFIGNAYLSEVDRIVSRHAPDFVRFVDDYRVFGTSRDALERAVVKISQDVEAIGFTINTSKLRLGSAEEYLDAIAKPQYNTIDSGNSYVSTRVFRDVLPADFMIAMIKRVVNGTQQFLNDGFGRLVLNALRRMRIDGALAQKMGAYGQWNDLTDHMPSTLELVTPLSGLIERAAGSADNVWSGVWAVFVLRDAMTSGPAHTEGLRALKAAISRSDMPPVVRLWAAAVMGDGTAATSDIETLHELGYLDGGRLAFGKELHA